MLQSMERKVIFPDLKLKEFSSSSDTECSTTGEKTKKVSVLKWEARAGC